MYYRSTEAMLRALPARTSYFPPIRPSRLDLPAPPRNGPAPNEAEEARARELLPSLVPPLWSPQPANVSGRNVSAPLLPGNTGARGQLPVLPPQLQPANLVARDVSAPPLPGGAGFLVDREYAVRLPSPQPTLATQSVTPPEEFVYTQRPREPESRDEQ